SPGMATQARRGVAAVELALLVSLFLVPLLLGIWEVGRLVEVQQLLDNAAREAGRQASTGQKTIAQVQQVAVDYLARNGISISTTAVTVTTQTNSGRSDPTAGSTASNAQMLDHFQVKITIPVDSFRWVLLNQITPARNLNATADWCSMNNVPLTVSATIPSQP